MPSVIDANLITTRTGTMLVLTPNYLPRCARSTIIMQCSPTASSTFTAQLISTIEGEWLSMDA